jgi:hypothetical protein
MSGLARRDLLSSGMALAVSSPVANALWGRTADSDPRLHAYPSCALRGSIEALQLSQLRA